MQAAGSQSPLTLDELFALLADFSRSEERRWAQRIEHQKRVVVICLGFNRATVRSDVSFGWIEDVSATGAKLSLPDSVTGERFWVRILGGGAQNPFLECRVQWRKPGAAGPTSRPDAAQTCGVRFERQLDAAEFAKALAGTDDVTE